MRYRSRLLAVILVGGALINGLSLAVLYGFASRALFEEVGNNALSVAAVTATFIDGEEHKLLQHPGDEQTESYRRISAALRKARDASRRDDTQVLNLYTLKPLGGDTGGLSYGADAEQNAWYKSSINQPVIIISGRQPVLEQAGVDRDGYSVDQYGQWLSANAPVTDRAGRAVAAVGADVPAAFVQAKLYRLKLAALLSFGLALAAGAGFAFVCSARASRPVRSIHQTLEAVGKGDLTARVEDDCADEFAAIARGINSMTDGLRDHEAVKSAFVSYVSPQALDKVLANGAAPAVEVERRRVTVLFSDIRGFTGTAEKMRPEEVVTLLNEYFERMVDVVVRHKGTVDKFIGDGLMAIFGAPEEDRFQEENAVYAALEMQREVRELSEKWEAEGRRPIRIGIGINSGNAIVGSIGSARRLEYTAVGDSVNLAARLESATKDLGADILISEYTLNGIQGVPVVITDRIETTVKGRDDRVVAYAIAARDEAEAALPPQVTA